MKEMDIHIKGIVKSSLIDYPDKISTVVFFSRCNFRCPYCHNPELIFNEEEFPDITPVEFFAFIDKKRKWIDGIVLLGGEPLMHPGILDFMREIKRRKLLVKLDTNGSFPLIIQKAIDEKLVDYIAMDIKNSQERYEETVCAKVSIEQIKKSVRLIINAGRDGLIDYEFRTTVLPKLHSPKDLEAIAQWIKGAKKYVLQQFKTEKDLIDYSFKDEKSYTHKELNEFSKIFEGKVDVVEVR